MIYGNRTSEDLGRLIIHELSHSFQNAILYKNRPSGMFDYNRPPLWVMEGHAEFMTGYWDSFNLMTVIDSVLNDRMPEIQEDGDIRADYGTNRTPVRFRPPDVRFLLRKIRQEGDPRPAAQPAAPRPDRQAPLLSGAFQLRAQDLQL